MSERVRTEWKRDDDEFFYPFDCLVCGEHHELWFNGGELDRTECCGIEYSLEHGRIDFVAITPDSEDPSGDDEA